ncbi:MAG: DsbA family protein, partial [Acidobacteriota bacterium]
HDKLFAEWKGENVGAFTKANLTRFASDLGLNSETFNACLDSDKYEGKVLLEKVEASEDLGVNSTPTVFVDGEMIKGLQYEAYQAAIEEALKEGS